MAPLKRLALRSLSHATPLPSLPRIAKEGKYVLKCRPQTLAINCNSTKFAVIDMNAVLYLYATAPSPFSSARSLTLFQV